VDNISNVEIAGKKYTNIHASWCSYIIFAIEIVLLILRRKIRDLRSNRKMVGMFLAKYVVKYSINQRRVSRYSVLRNVAS
jgi:hypothetical protein